MSARDGAVWLAAGRVLAAVKRVRGNPTCPDARAALASAWAWRRAIQARGGATYQWQQVALRVRATVAPDAVEEMRAVVEDQERQMAKDAERRLWEGLE